jgi:MYXO-CTERM domain-containing protein
VKASPRNELFLLACLAAAGTIVGSIGTWESGFATSESGTADGGVYTLWLGGLGILALLASWRGRRRDPCFIATLLGCAISGIALYRLIDLAQESGPLGTDPVDPGWGVWLTVFAGGALALCSFLLVRAVARRSSGEQ